MSGKKRFQIEVEDRVIWVKANGTWTSLTVADYIADIRTKANALAGKPWAIVLDARDWQACPADVFTQLQENTHWCLQRQLRLGVVLLPEQPLLRWQFAKATEGERPEHYQKHVVEDEAAARLIIQQAGYFKQKPQPQQRA
ncbi:hypothetical protein Q3O60_13055 [Alkalimonas collagenimarina]|uniref:STAS/SEC14 domain-containing protein n=1 Tax=Alkalimonas collagenimarina TaxID=400390 RepID=A0ABT9H1C5_9GAMM|nr:hypothetical protein [Alkalimonas collagenimarina]MDP4537119.1 hypothetical protein [Alkalimonas collagenimarina]